MSKRSRSEETQSCLVTDEAAKEHGIRFSLEGEEEYESSCVKRYHADGMLSGSRRMAMVAAYEEGAKALGHDVDAAIRHLTRATTIRNTERKEKQEYKEGLKPPIDRDVAPGKNVMIVLEKDEQRDDEAEVEKTFGNLHGTVARVVREIGGCVRVEFDDGQQADIFKGNVRLYKNEPDVMFKYNLKRGGE